jgi:hypothetical protein
MLQYYLIKFIKLKKQLLEYLKYGFEDFTITLKNKI